ncbi:MAG: PAS domain S-box protein [Gammaproteobacteria bacterium]|nr:PAS domain S-box protein [Gammaproteobacteria bacterium]
MEEIISYQGEITQRQLTLYMDVLENNIAHPVMMANISTIVIEVCQNIMKYCQKENSLSNDLAPVGTLRVFKLHNDDYLISSSNIVSKGDKEKLEPRLKEVQSLDQKSIKKKYRELRRSGKNTHAKGGGVGTYEIAKISDAITYRFEAINDQQFSYTLDVSVKSKAKLDKKCSYNILLVSDSKEERQRFLDIYKDKEYELVVTSHKDNIMDIFNEKDVDLLFIDMVVEDDNRLKFLVNHDNKINQLLKIPVLVLSESFSPKMLKISHKSGVKDIISKPYTEDEILFKTEFWTIFRKHELEKIEQFKILNEYKDAVDESAIVSKTDSEGIITYVNDAFCRISGYSREELIGQNHNIISHPDTSQETYQDLWHSICRLKQSWQGEIKNKTKNGSCYWVRSFIKPILDRDRNIVEYIAIRVDISDIKLAQLQLQAQKDAMDHHAIISMTDLEGNITYVNEKFCEISGYSKEELLGQNHRILSSDYCNKDYWRNMYCQVKSDKLWQDQIRNRAKDGSFYWVDTTIVPLYNRENEHSGYTSIRTDVTEEVKVLELLSNNAEQLENKILERTLELEQALKETQLAKEQSEKANQIKTRFLQNMSHELRTPMHGILSYSSMGLNRVEKSTIEKNTRFFSNINQSAERLMKLLNDIIEVSTLESDKKSLKIISFSTTKIIKDSIAKYQKELNNKGVGVVLETCDNDQADLDISHISEVIDKLLSNAIKFSASGQTIDIKSSHTQHNDLPAIEVSIRDYGEGIYNDNFNSIFETFEQGENLIVGTTQGTGLGLAIAKQIIEIHQGKIWAENHPDGGAVFRFIIPLEHRITS